MSGRGRIFENPRILERMLTLYRNGCGSNFLANEFNCDHTTILYWVNKYGVTQGKNRVKKYIPKIEKKKGNDPYLETDQDLIRFRKEQIIKKDKEMGERVREGKMYKDYLKDAGKLLTN